MQTIYGGAGAKYCINSYNCETVMTEEQLPEKSASETRLASLPLKIGDIVLKSHTQSLTRKRLLGSSHLRHLFRIEVKLQINYWKTRSKKLCPFYRDLMMACSGMFKFVCWLRCSSMTSVFLSLTLPRSRRSATIFMP